MYLKHLFQPINVGGMLVKNRIVMAPMGGPRLGEDALITPTFEAYYVERAKSRPGMITVGLSAVEPDGMASRGDILIWDDSCIPPLSHLVAAVHQYDVKFGIELCHAGAQSKTAKTPKTPSGIPAVGIVKTPPRAITRAEISDIVAAFGKAAVRCATAGFDYLEIHGAHGYLINEFLSPYFNKRNDEYGGSLANRARFLLEVIAECKRLLGKNFPLGVRVNGEDFTGRGTDWTVKDACELAPMLQQSGITYISVTIGVYGGIRQTVPPMYEDQGAFVHLAEQVKKCVSIPVATVGRIKTPAMADRIIAEGKADLIIMGRALIADPELPEKAREGQLADIRPCIADCLGCAEQILKAELSCTVNPRVGRESSLGDKPQRASVSRKVLVAGAGCAGLEAARQAALAGHKVIIYESRGWIGGQLRLAAKIPKRKEIWDIVPWYERQLNRLGIEIRLNSTVTEQVLNDISPDVVVVATGSLAQVPLGYVIGLENVSRIQLLTADEVLEEEIPTGDNIVVIGVDHIGLQIADYLAQQGKKVYAFGNSPHFAERMAGADSYYLMDRLKERDVRRSRKVAGIEIRPTDEVWVQTDKGTEKLAQIDTMVFADKRQPNTSLAEMTTRRGIETCIVGDAAGTTRADQGTILAAIASGFEAGRRI